MPEITKAEEVIYEGRRKYNEKQFKPALELFTRAMKLCPCYRGMKRERCSCKDFQTVAAKDESIFKEAMYNCTCAVGKTFNKCDNTLHIQALDYRAATFETLKSLDRAKRDAEWILELAPRLPDGYLRLAKIARLQKDDEFAWKIYNAGIDVAQNNYNASSKKVQQLYAARKPLQILYARKDPFFLPLEIVQWILSYCELVTRVRCLRVSKLWNELLSAPGNANLWRNLDFTGRSAPKTSPRTDGLRKLTAKACNDVRRLTISNAYIFGLMQSKFLALLNGAKRLEHLEIGHIMRGLEIPKYAGLCKTLKSLSLYHFDPNVLPKHTGHDIVQSFPYSFIDNTANVLQNLHLNGIPGDWFDGRSMPPMPNLKTLRLQLKIGAERMLPLMFLAKNTPNLEQLWLDEVWLQQSPDWVEHWDAIWEKLKAITIVAQCTPSRAYMPAVTILTSIHCGQRLKYLDLCFAAKTMPSEDLLTAEPVNEMLRWNNPRVAMPGVLPRSNTYKSISEVRLQRMPLDPVNARHMFQEAIDSNRMQAIDIVFPLESLNSKLGSKSSLHLAGYEWLRGAHCIKSMGISDFRFRSYSKSESDFPLPHFLASFTGLVELELSSCHYDDVEFCVVAEAIFRVTRLKVFYQSQVKGAVLDQLLRVGERYDVKIVWGERPRLWPVPLDDQRHWPER